LIIYLFYCCKDRLLTLSGFIEYLISSSLAGETAARATSVAGVPTDHSFDIRAAASGFIQYLHLILKIRYIEVYRIRV
jgi:hypothetical protein